MEDDNDPFDAMECGSRADRGLAIHGRKHQLCRVAPPWARPLRLPPSLSRRWRGRFLPAKAEECRERLKRPPRSPGACGSNEPRANTRCGLSVTACRIPIPAISGLLNFWRCGYISCLR
jgi:hypothetical protein